MLLASNNVWGWRTWRWPGEPLLEQTNPDTLVTDSTQWTQILSVKVRRHVLVKTCKLTLTVMTPSVTAAHSSTLQHWTRSTQVLVWCHTCRLCHTTLTLSRQIRACATAADNYAYNPLLTACRTLWRGVLRNLFPEQSAVISAQRMFIVLTWILVSN